MIFLILFIELMVGFSWAKAKPKIQLPAQTIEYHYGDIHFKALKTSKSVAFINDGQTQHLNIQSCNKKKVDQFWSGLVSAARSGKAVRGLASKRLNKEAWVIYKNKKRPILGFRSPRAKLNKTPKTFMALRSESIQSCEVKKKSKRKTASEADQDSEVVVNLPEIPDFKIPDARTPAQQCVEALCPDAAFSSYEVDQEVDRRQRGMVYISLEPYLRETNKVELDYQIEKAKHIQEWIKTAPPVTDPTTIRTISLWQYIDASNEKAVFKVDGQKVVMDEVASRPLFPEMIDAEFRLMVQVMNRAYEVNQDPPIKASSIEEIELYYPGNMFKAKVDEAMATLKEMIAQLKNDPRYATILKTFILNEMDDQSLMHLHKNLIERPSTELLEEFNDAFLGARIMLMIENEEKFKTLLTASAINIQKASQFFSVEERLQKNIASFEEQKKEWGGLPGLGVCSHAIAAGEIILPTEEQLSDYRKRFPMIKSNFLKKMKGYFSVHSYGLISKSLNAWTLNLPLSREKHWPQLRRGLSENQETQKNNAKIYNDIIKTPQANSYLAIEMMNDPQEDGMNSVAEVCSDATPKALPDKADPSTGRVAVGPMVLRFGEKAEGIIYHELGHLIDNEIQSPNMSQETQKTRTDIKSCLVGIHKDNGLQVQDEDYADLVSFAVDSPSNRFTCLMNRTSIVEYAAMDLKNVPNDEHSSDFYRLLHEEFSKTGSIPEVCHQALKVHGETANFKNCLPPAKAR